ncbi:MAG TPA: dynamin family protein [Burkholderiaceae bacterium]|nr:dynamin family protein [Burkholderiaceae bacterium]
MAQLASSFQEYSAWRDALASSVVQLRRWLEQTQLLEGDAARRLDVALDRLGEDKLVIAFVAEFSRGKSELINAIFFADYGRRILPSSAGRTTMCPTELLYDESLPPCIRALPIETRARFGTTSDFKKATAEWRVFPVDTDSPDGMLQAFKLVAETVRVSADEARMYGLYDPDDKDQVVAVDKQGMIEISRWRHAVINFPHPLLKQGLVILDTPGLNAIGTEPELTLSLVPSSHAVLFVLAADTGVTKSDLDVWRHIIGDSGSASNHIAVLNKIDGLWDALKSEAEIEAEVEKQVHSVSGTLGLDASRVFPVSAQKGLVAKVTDDQRLLRLSRLPALESALVDLLVPAKQRIVREQTIAVIDRITGEVRQALATRERGLIEQLYELRALQGKNQSSIERMLIRAQTEQRDFEENVRKIVAARVVLARLANEAYAPLRLDSLRARVLEARERMRKVRLTPQFFAAVKDYFGQIRDLVRQSNAKLLEIEQMVLGVQRRFAEDLGWSLSPPMPYALDTYLAELERAEAAYKNHFGALAVLTRDKWALIERFFDTVVSKSREVFAAAERDTEAWVRSLLPPIEVQVREQRAQLKKRAESVARIRDAQESLDARIGELEEALEDVQQRLDELKKFSNQARGSAARESGAAPRPAVEAELPAYLRVEI